MKLEKTEIFGTVRRPASFDDLLKFTANCPLPDSGFITRMWRGQGDISWPVHSSGYRRIKPKRDSDLATYEKSLLEQATHQGYRFVEGRELPDFELLARLQHHGAATRLVDSSRNALVALWFCCNSEPKKTGALIGVHTHHLAGYEGETENRNYSKIIDELKGDGNLFTWEPPAVTKRIASQNSQFLYSEVQNEKTGSLVLPKEEDVTVVISIRPELKEECLTILQEAFDIRHLTLFPDIDGFCASNSVDKIKYYNNRW